MDGSTPASPATARTVVRSKPSSLKRRRAAARIAARVGPDRSVKGMAVLGSRGVSALTVRQRLFANKRWPTVVGMMATDGQRSSGAVVITGASTGIGRATALALSRAGFHVYAGVRRPADGVALRSLAEGELTPVILDVTDQD